MATWGALIFIYTTLVILKGVKRFTLDKIYFHRKLFQHTERDINQSISLQYTGAVRVEATGQTQHFALFDFNKSTEAESKHVSLLKIQKGWQGGFAYCTTQCTTQK